jgi:hypothetical protein
MAIRIPFAPTTFGLLAFACATPAQSTPSQSTPSEPATPVDLDQADHPSLRATLGDTQRALDDWIDRFRLYGFLGARAFDTTSGGARPDGAMGIQAAALFVEADVRDVASVFLEVRADYFQEAGGNQVDLGETYIRLRDVLHLAPGADLGLKVGRFDLPFGEWYLLEDPNKNRMIGFPAAIPYRWDEGLQAMVDTGGWGGNLALTDGTYSRNSATGIGPAVTLRAFARPIDGLYVSASGLYIDEADASALCFGGSVIVPVAGSAAGSSPSAAVRSSLGSLDLRCELGERLLVQGSVGGGRIDDEVDTFDRTIAWWMLETSWAFSTDWRLTGRWSGAGTFARDEGFRFEGRPYANGTASYGFDLTELQRVAACLQWTIAKDLLAKAEVGFDHLTATDQSGIPNDTRPFVAAELVLSF